VRGVAGRAAYVNVCRADKKPLPVLATQRTDTEAVVTGAGERSAVEEAAGHGVLIERPGLLFSRAQA
jgi:hypothetical protein